MRNRAFSCTGLLVVAVLAAGLCSAVSASVPADAKKYQRTLIAEAKAVWGPGAPIALFAGQIHQESGWNPEARSAYAAGLAQFTPDTAKWIAGAYPRELAEGQPLSPQWAIRALVIYDLHLWKGVTAAAPCDRMAMALSAYNGGAGNLRKDLRLCESTGRIAACAAAGDGAKRGPVAVAESRASLQFADLRSDGGLGFRRVSAAKEMIRDTKAPMFAVMLPVRHDRKIAGTEVGSVLVPVVHENIARKLGLQDVLGDQSVHVNHLVADIGTRVAVIQKNATGVTEANLVKNVSQFRMKVADSHVATIPAQPACVKCDSLRWFNNVEKRSGRATWAFKENRDYPRKILLRWQQLYAAWGPAIVCPTTV